MNGHEGEGFDCAECADLGDYQCSVHGVDVIEAQRAEHEYHQLREALEAIAALPHAWQSGAYAGLVERAGEVLHEMKCSRGEYDR